MESNFRFQPAAKGAQNAHLTNRPLLLSAEEGAMRRPRVHEMQPGGRTPSWRRTCRWLKTSAAALLWPVGAAAGRTRVEGGMVGIPTAAASRGVVRRT